MRGGKRTRIVLQARDTRALEFLHRARVADRDMLRQAAGFGSVTRTNSRLTLLTDAGLLARIAVGTKEGGHKYLYACTRAGAAAVGQQYRVPPWNADSSIVAGQRQLEHQLRLNQFNIALCGQPYGDQILHVGRWTTFRTPPFPAVAGLIPDAYVEIRFGSVTRAFFVEVDLATEPRKTWLRKVDNYLALAHSGAFAPAFGHEQFGVLVTTPSSRRLHSLRQTIATRTSKVFWLTTFDNVDATRIWSPVWWRPTGASPIFMN